MQFKIPSGTTTGYLSTIHFLREATHFDQMHGFCILEATMVTFLAIVDRLITTSVQQNNNHFTASWTLSGTTWVSRYQKGKINLDLLEQEIVSGSGITWAIMQICTFSKTGNHASIPPLSFFTGRIPFLPPNQQHQSTEGTITTSVGRCEISSGFYVTKSVQIDLF